jgi:hypothetical protein
MKILKYMLILILFLIVVTIGVLFFSGKIIESKLNTKETQIENFKFSLGKREITFDNISINGNKMGPGRATISLRRFFENMFDKEIYFNEIEFTNTDFNTLFAAPDENIDKFISKIQVPSPKGETEETDKTSDEIADLESKTDELLNFDFTAQVEELEKLKREFLETQDLDTKISKLKEISEKSEKIKKDIMDKKTLINERIAELDSENTKALNTYTDNLEELNNTIKAGNVDNIKRITFIDRGRDILQDLNLSLKTAKVAEDFDKSDISAKKVILQSKDQKMEITNIGMIPGNTTVDYQTKDAVYGITKEKDSGVYKIQVKRDRLLENVLYENDKITADIEYTKKNFLPDIPDIVIETKLLYNNDILNISSNNSITDEQENFIKESIEKIKQERLAALSEKYNTENTRINSIQDQLYTREKELDIQISKLKVLTISSNIINTLGE